MIFELNNIFLDLNLPDKDAVFRFIARQTELQKYHGKSLSKDPSQIYQALWNREREISTGLEKGFAIPHAQTDAIITPTLFYIKLQNAIDWQNHDQTLVKHLFVILVTKSNPDNTHLDTLSKVALLVADDQAVESLNNCKTPQAVYQVITSFLDSRIKKPQPITNHQKGLIIGLTACPVGIAHTYLSAEKLEQAIIAQGYRAKVETRGAAGPKNEITDQEIDQAELLIVASDIELDLSKFGGKKIYRTNTKSAVHNPDQVVQAALNNAEPLNKSNVRSNIHNGKLDQDSNGKIIKHLLTGISHMIPFVIFGGLMIALAIGLGKTIYGSGVKEPPKGDFLWWLLKSGVTSFNVMIGVLGGYIAYSIAGRSALMPGIVVSLVANNPDHFFSIAGVTSQTPMGFLGAILFGLLIGYTVKWMNQLKLPKSLAAAMPMFIIPIGLTMVYSLVAMFLIGTPISYVMGQFISALKNFFNSSKNDVNLFLYTLIGIVIGAMAGFDMGGPVNKMAFLTCTSLVTTQVYQPMGMMGAAIPVAPMGMAFATIFFRKKFNQQERSLGISAIFMGFIGISEGAIPFAIADPKKVITANVVGSAVAGGTAAVLGVGNKVSHGGPIIGVLGGITSTHGDGIGILYYMLAILLGILVTGLMYGFWRNNELNIIRKKSIIRYHHFQNMLNRINHLGHMTFGWTGNKVKNIRDNLPVHHKTLIKISLAIITMLLLLTLGILLLVLGHSDYIRFIQTTSSRSSIHVGTYIYGATLLSFLAFELLIFIIWLYTNQKALHQLKIRWWKS